MQQAKVGLEVGCIFGVAQSKTLRDEKAALLLFALVCIRANHVSTNHKSYLRGHIHRMLVTLGVGRLNNERRPGAEWKSAGLRNGVTELHLCRLDDLYDHLHPQATVFLRAKDRMERRHSDGEIGI